MSAQPTPNESPANSDVHVGQILFAEYSVERLLGEGGYGAVHLVTSQVTGEQFALKRALLQDDAGRSELLAEVRAWMNVPRYPHIVACRFFRVSGKAVYIFAEYVDGGSLDDSRRTGRLYEGEPQAVLARVLELAVESAWGLHAAQQAGLIHQDVKPSNIFVTADWVAKVADFGLTEKRRPDPTCEAVLEYLIQDTEKESIRERMRGILRGQLKADDQHEVQGRGAFTASHASPEQLGGTPLTRGTDVWSWGVTLLDLFNGKCTWELGTDAPTALSEIAANGPAVEGLPRLPRRAVAVIERCFQADPGQRWQSFGEAADELMVAYQETLQRPFPRVMPPLSDIPSTTFTRQLPSGSEWPDPRPWLVRAYSLAGKDEAEARLHFPEPTGSITSRAVSDLEALEHALGIFEEVNRSGRPDIAGDLARLHGNTGLLCSFLGDVAGAIGHYDTCAELLAASSHLQDQIDAVTAWNSKAIALRKAGHRAESAEVCDRALGFWRGLAVPPPPGERDRMLALLLNTKANAAESPSETLRLRTEAVSLSGLDEPSRARYLAGQASDFGEVEDWTQYEETARRARDLIERLIREEYRQDLKGLLGTLALNCARLEEQRGRWAQALNYLDEAVATLEPLVALEGQWELAEHIGNSYFEKGRTLEALGRPMEAVAAYRAAREKLSELVLRGGRSDLADNLAGAMRNEANINLALDRIAEAAQLSRSAVEFFRRLGRGDQHRRYLPLIARALSVHSGSLLAEGHAPEAVEAAKEAVSLFRSLPPDDAERKSLDFAGALMAFGIAARRVGDPQSTWDAYQEARAILEPADDLNSLQLKALIEHNSGNLLGDNGDLSGSLLLVEEAIKTWEGVARRFGPGLGREDLIIAYKAKSIQLLKLGAYEEALAASDQALPLLAGLVDEGRTHLREELGKLWSTRALILKKLGNLAGAVEAFTESARIFNTASSPRRPPDLDVAGALLRQADELKALAALRAQDAEHWAARAEDELRTGSQMSRGGDTFHACELFDEAILIYSVMAERQPGPRWLEALARTQMQLGIVAMHCRRDVAAERAFRGAIENYDRLIREFQQPDLENWGKACLGLAVFLKTMSRVEDSAAVMSAASDGMRSLGEEKYAQWQRWAEQTLQSV